MSSAKPLCFSSSPSREVVLNFQDMGWEGHRPGETDGKTTPTQGLGQGEISYSGMHAK